MVTVTINQNEVGRTTSIQREFKSHRNAFMAAHNAARYFWIDHSEKKFPTDILVCNKWHFEPSAGVTMDVVFEPDLNLSEMQ